jgi:hypothetical protein
MHEIGHALGMGHSNDRNSVMYALYNDNIKLELQTDDIYAIQRLYNPAPPVIPTSSTTTAKTVQAHKLCNLTNLQEFLIINQFMYVFYKEWF